MINYEDKGSETHVKASVQEDKLNVKSVRNLREKREKSDVLKYNWDKFGRIFK